MSNIRFTMKDLDGTVMPYTSFVISTSASANAASFTTNTNGEATVSLAAVSTPYYISKQDGTTESVIAYKFFVPDTTYTLDAELLFVDMGKISKDKNDKSIAALIEAKVVAVNAANRALQVVSLLGDVSTIRDNLDTLVQVASNLTNIETVADTEANINVVADNTANINKVASIDANVTDVANSQTNVNTVAANIANVNAVAPYTASIATVATNVGSVNTVSGSIASVNTTASNIANVNTVAGNTSNISSVAGISPAVSTVANNIADIQATADGIAGIPVVMPYVSNITTVASNIDPVVAVGNNINNINEVRAMEADIEVLADEIANIAGAAAAVTQAVDAQKVLYVAGTDYTKNTSNTLVLPYFPAKSNSVKIFFDGAYKNKDTWNRVGKNIVFTSVINVDKVEIQYEVPSSFVGLSPEDILVIQNAEAAAQASEVDAQQSATAAAVSASLAQGVANQAVDAIKQLFVAGVGFTKGVSTQLTMDFIPVKTNAVKVFFDGVYQNKNTFTRVGKVITFNEAINVDNVEIHYEVPSQFVGLDDDDNAVLVAAQNAAQASANAAAASFDSFDDRYLGAKNVTPTLDNDGNALLVGAKYFNSTENKMYVRNSSNAWQLDTADSSTVNYDGGTVQDVLDSAKPIANYTALRAYTGRATTVRITAPGIAGFFRKIASGVDNGGTVIVGAFAWERVFDDAVITAWFEADGDGLSDETVGLKAAFTYAMPLGKTVVLQGDYKVSGPLHTVYGQSSASLHIHCVGAVNITVDHSATAFRDLIYCESTEANNGSITGGRLRIDLAEKCASGITCRHNAVSAKGAVNFSAQVTVVNAKANDSAAIYENQGIAVIGNYLSVAMQQPTVIGVTRINPAGACKGISVSEFSGGVDIYSPYVANVVTPGLSDADGIAVFGKSAGGGAYSARLGSARIHSPMIIDCQVRSIKSQCSDTIVFRPTIKRQMIVAPASAVDIDFQMGNGLVIEPSYEYLLNGAISPVSSSHSCVAFQQILTNQVMVGKSVGGVLRTEVQLPRYATVISNSSALASETEVSGLKVIPVGSFASSAFSRAVMEFAATYFVAKSSKTTLTVTGVSGPLQCNMIGYTDYASGSMASKLSIEVTANKNTLAYTSACRDFLNLSGNVIVDPERYLVFGNHNISDAAAAGFTFNFNNVADGSIFYVDISTVVATNPPPWGASGWALIECLGNRISTGDKSVRVTKDNAETANTMFFTRNGGTTWGVIK